MSITSEDKGIMLYNPAFNYMTNHKCLYNGIVYTSIINNNRNSVPSINSTDWTYDQLIHLNKSNELDIATLPYSSNPTPSDKVLIEKHATAINDRTKVFSTLSDLALSAKADMLFEKTAMDPNIASTDNIIENGTIVETRTHNLDVGYLPDPNTLFLYHANTPGSFIDESASAIAMIDNNGVSFNNTVNMEGTYSLEFNKATQTYLSFTAGNGFTFPGEFTFEADVILKSNNLTCNIFGGMQLASDPNSISTIGFGINNNNAFALIITGQASGLDLNITHPFKNGALVLNTPHHIAYIRDKNNDIKMYLDYKLQYIIPNQIGTIIIDPTSAVYLGYAPTPTLTLDGFLYADAIIDRIRISNIVRPVFNTYKLSNRNISEIPNQSLAVVGEVWGKTGWESVSGGSNPLHAIGSKQLVLSTDLNAMDIVKYTDINYNSVSTIIGNVSLVGNNNVVTTGITNDQAVAYDSVNNVYAMVYFDTLGRVMLVSGLYTTNNIVWGTPVIVWDLEQPSVPVVNIDFDPTTGYFLIHWASAIGQVHVGDNVRTASVTPSGVVTLGVNIVNDQTGIGIWYGASILTYTTNGYFISESYQSSNGNNIKSWKIVSGEPVFVNAFYNGYGRTDGSRMALVYFNGFLIYSPRGGVTGSMCHISFDINTGALGVLAGGTNINVANNNMTQFHPVMFASDGTNTLSAFRLTSTGEIHIANMKDPASWGNNISGSNLSFYQPVATGEIIPVFTDMAFVYSTTVNSYYLILRLSPTVTKVLTVTLSGTTPQVINTIVLTNDITMYNNWSELTYDSINDIFVAAVKNTSNSNSLESLILFGNLTTPVDATNAVGVLLTTGLVGSTQTIATSGTLVSGFINKIPHTKVYIQSDGTVGEVVTPYLLGYWFTPTSLYVNIPRLSSNDIGAEPYLGQPANTDMMIVSGTSNSRIWKTINQVVAQAIGYFLSHIINEPLTVRTLSLWDINRYIRCTAVTPITINLHSNGTFPAPIGTRIHISMSNSGSVTIVAALGVIINSVAGNLTIATQFSTIVLTKVAIDEWDMITTTT